MSKLQFISVVLLLVAIEYRLETMLLNRPIELRKVRDAWSGLLVLTAGVFTVLGLVL